MTDYAIACRSMIRLHGSLFLTLAVTLALFLAGCASTPSTHKPDLSASPATEPPYTINDTTYKPLTSAQGYWERGRASWYGEQFHGQETANGEVFDMFAMTAAHKTLPMNTVLLVRNLENGRKALVRVNDRGPFGGDRIIDLSYRAASKIGMVDNGVAPIEVIALGGNAISAYTLSEFGLADKEAICHESENGVPQAFAADATGVPADLTEGRLALREDPRNSWIVLAILSHFIEFASDVTGRFPPEGRLVIEMYACHGGDFNSAHSGDVPS